jgi:hypothetical protein
VRRAFSSAPSTLSDRDLGRLCQNLIELDLARYVKRWWAPSEKQKEAFRDRLDALAPAVARATRRRNAYRQTRAEHEAQIQRARTEATERIDDLQSALGTAPLSATNEQPDTYYPTDASFSFGWVDDASQIGIYWNGMRTGTLDPFGPHRLDASTLLDLPWDAMAGRFDGVGQGRSRLRFTIDWTETERRLAAQAEEHRSPPDPPTEQTRLLTGASFRRGYDLLRPPRHSPTAHIQCESGVEL